MGGQYAYLREAFGPLVAFLYGWGLLLVIQSGGMAAVAVTFAHYARELAAIPIGAGGIATVVLLALTIVNCVGVRAGATVQSVLMVIKIAAIVGLIVTGLFFAPSAPASGGEPPASTALVPAMGAALVPVLFAYGGWQTSSFVAGELKRPERDLPRGLLLGVTGVVLLYLAVNAVCVRVLGPEGLAATTTPASEVMRRALGETGARAIAVGIAVSTLGFLSQSMLTAPRVYYAMAKDGLFFRTRGPRPSRDARPDRGHRPAGDPGGGDRPLGALRADPELRRLGGLHRLRPHGGRALRVPAAGRARGVVPYAGPSRDHGLLRRGLVPGRRQHGLALSREHAHRPRHPRRWRAGLPVLAEGPVTRAMGSEYMEWAKLHSGRRFNLASSGVVEYPLSDLPVRLEDLMLSGPGAYGWPPLLQRLAAKCGVSPDNVVAAMGTSMANHLALATLAGPGDEVVIERPAYDPMVSVARYLGAEVRRFDRRAEDGFAVRPDEVARAVTPRTKAIVLTNLHNPSSALIDTATLRRVGAIARDAGARVLVDEVYLDSAVREGATLVLPPR